MKKDTLNLKQISVFGFDGSNDFNGLRPVVIGKHFSVFELFYHMEDFEPVVCPDCGKVHDGDWSDFVVLLTRKYMDDYKNEVLDIITKSKKYETKEEAIAVMEILNFQAN